MKKKLFIICALLFMCFSVYAVDGILENHELAVVADEPSLFQEFLDTNTLGSTDFNEFIERYKFIEVSYNPPVSELNLLLTLVLEGYDQAVVIEAYHYWRGSAEDVSIVRDMCDLYNPNDRYWTENAFNNCTNNKYGVLDAQDVTQYYANGLDREDIEIADSLSRRGHLTVQQILDKRTDGIEFNDILDEAENGQSLLRRSRRMRGKKQDILVARELSEITTESIDVLLAQADDGIDLADAMEQKITEINDKVYTEIEGLLKTPDRLSPEQIASNESLISAIEERGVSRERIDTLLEDYSLMQIYEASAQMWYNGIPLDDALQINDTSVQSKHEHNTEIDIETGTSDNTDEIQMEFGTEDDQLESHLEPDTESSNETSELSEEQQIDSNMDNEIPTEGVDENA